MGEVCCRVLAGAWDEGACTCTLPNVLLWLLQDPACFCRVMEPAEGEAHIEVPQGAAPGNPRRLPVKFARHPDMASRWGWVLLLCLVPLLVMALMLSLQASLCQLPDPVTLQTVSRRPVLVPPSCLCCLAIDALLHPILLKREAVGCRMGKPRFIYN